MPRQAPNEGDRHFKMPCFETPHLQMAIFQTLVTIASGLNHMKRPKSPNCAIICGNFMKQFLGNPIKTFLGNPNISVNISPGKMINICIK